MNDSSVLSTIYLCEVWSPLNHVLFQMANAFLLISYLATNTIYGLLYLRLCLAVGSLFFAIWGWIVLCAADTLIWNIIFTIINALYLISIIWKLHPFIRFPHDVEMVYRCLFQPLHVPRNSFKKLYLSSRKIQTLKSKEIYAVESQTSVGKLSLLLSGRVSVKRSGKTLHIIDCHQFLDSPEWFGVESHDTYLVSIVALEESRLLVWDRDKLKLLISRDTYLQAVLDNILGKDVVKKLLSITYSMANQQLNANEQAKLILPSNGGMNQLIKRNSINGKDINMNSFWDLSRITESDTETCI